MIPAAFDYHRAASVEDAVRLLGNHEDAKLLAGGHSLIPMMKLRLAQPAVLIDIGRIGALRGVQRDGDAVRIGALTTHAELASSEVLATDCPLIAAAAATIGDPVVRNKGTIGGNIAHADPASDLPAALVATGATVHMQGAGGARAVAAADFFVDLLATAVEEGEILTAVTVPVAAGAGAAYKKAEHPASGYAVCGAAALVRLGADGTATDVRLCFNGVSATPHNASAVAEALNGSTFDDSAIESAVGTLAIDEPLGDLHASGAYRVQLARVYGKRALREARDRAHG